MEIQISKEHQQLLSDFIGKEVAETIDWNGLMPVVEKIGKTKMEALGTVFTSFPYQIRDKYFLIHCHDGKRQEGVIYQTPYGKSEPDTITAVYKGVIAFIIFVNTGRLQLDDAIERYFKQQKT